MNLTSERLYLDYNATSPFSRSVIELMREGDSLFGNPSSLHHTGKYANRFMRETRDYIHALFDSEEFFRIIFHSGATEGINFFFRSLIFKFYTEGVRPLFLFSQVDHSASYNLKPLLESLGFPVFLFSVDQDGLFDLDEIKSAIEKYGDLKADVPAVLNYLFVNNETGVWWDLAAALELKKRYNIIVHVDAVQSVGKIKGWKKLIKHLDCYTYSCHKFGSLKGVGFSLLSHRLKLTPFLYGGGQQEGLRSGTENVLGIYSIKKAFTDLLNKEDFISARTLKSKFLMMLRDISGLTIIGQQQDGDAINTVMVAFEGKDANTLLTAFDMAKIDISSGSACSSGISQPNRILLNMGYQKSVASSALRFSWDPFAYSEEQWHTIVDRVRDNLLRFS